MLGVGIRHLRLIVVSDPGCDECDKEIAEMKGTGGKERTKGRRAADNIKSPEEANQGETSVKRK